MKDEKYPPVEEYYCKKCRKKFTPAYYPILCTNCGRDNVIPVRLLKVPNRDWNNDPSYLDYILRNRNKDIEKDEGEDRGNNT